MPAVWSFQSKLALKNKKSPTTQHLIKKHIQIYAANHKEYSSKNIFWINENTSGKDKWSHLLQTTGPAPQG